jgi:hypothetical protein
MIIVDGILIYVCCKPLSSKHFEVYSPFEQPFVALQAILLFYYLLLPYCLFMLVKF